METWRDAIDFESYYEVSNYGNVRRKGKTNPLAKVLDKDGYVVHVFSINNIRHNVMAHQLVAAAFIGPRPIGLLTLHEDGNKLNNCPLNLYYGTSKQNTADAVRHGTLARGTAHGNAKLTDKDVIAIRVMTGTREEVAKAFGVSQATVSNIINRKIWRHV